jgi:hypothetical protein
VEKENSEVPDPVPPFGANERSDEYPEIPSRME